MPTGTRHSRRLRGLIHSAAMYSALRIYSFFARQVVGAREQTNGHDDQTFCARLKSSLVEDSREQHAGYFTNRRSHAGARVLGLHHTVILIIPETANGARLSFPAVKRHKRCSNVQTVLPSDVTMAKVSAGRDDQQPFVKCHEIGVFGARPKALLPQQSVLRKNSVCTSSLCGHNTPQLTTKKAHDHSQQQPNSVPCVFDLTRRRADERSNAERRD